MPIHITPTPIHITQLFTFQNSYCREANAIASYRHVASEKVELAAELKTAKSKLHRLQEKLENATKKEESVQAMRRVVHVAESRATSLEKVVEELSAAKLRALDR